ncbi:MAG: DUF4263 domain-containing protein [Desulfuromonadaceae bacterium]|nr:DUF4263 domain-containing protein [Desulfuromonadaceae bacterium]
MDEILFNNGARRLRVCVVGFNRETGTVPEADFRLSIYAYDTETCVTPRFTHILDIEGARRLFIFLNSISLLRDETHVVSGRFLEINDEIPHSVIEAIVSHPQIIEDPAFVRAVLDMNPELCRTILETQVEALDISSLAYRRSQLSIMRRLLDDNVFFLDYQNQLHARGQEAVWQYFFEQNQWIFGYGLNYVIGEGVQPDKLEQVVTGYSIAGAGKRVDGLLYTRGLLRSLCYVEIKTHNTRLLHSTEYRPAVWHPSNELIGAVAQLQKTVQLAVEHLTTTFDLPVGAGVNGGERFFNYSPRSVLVCGNLEEFVEDAGVNIPKFSSFELYRRNINTPDIVTFDELYDRASSIVEASFATRTEGGNQLVENV